MAAARRNSQELLAQLDARHDKLLSRLEDLNARILVALAELVPADRRKAIGHKVNHNDTTGTKKEVEFVK